jgi:hypothetical protein
LAEFPENSFLGVYRGTAISVDGIFTSVNLDDVVEFEKTYIEGRLTKSSFLEGRNVEAPVSCTEYYLVITTYLPDGTISEDETYLYTLCVQSTGASSGGGGGSSSSTSSQPTLRTPLVTLLVAKNYVGDHWWGANATWRLSGWRMPNRSQSYYNANPTFIDGNSLFDGIAGATDNSNLWFGQLDPNKYHTENLLNDRLAHGYFNGTMIFYNQTDPGSGQPHRETVSEHGYWRAPATL